MMARLPLFWVPLFRLPLLLYYDSWIVTTLIDYEPTLNCDYPFEYPFSLLTPSLITIEPDNGDTLLNCDYPFDDFFWLSLFELPFLSNPFWVTLFDINCEHLDNDNPIIDRNYRFSITPLDYPFLFLKYDHLHWILPSPRIFVPLWITLFFYSTVTTPVEYANPLEFWLSFLVTPFLIILLMLFATTPVN